MSATVTKTERDLHMSLANKLGEASNCLEMMARFETIGSATYIDLAEEFSDYVQQLSTLAAELEQLAKDSLEE